MSQIIEKPPINKPNWTKFIIIEWEFQFYVRFWKQGRTSISRSFPSVVLTTADASQFSTAADSTQHLLSAVQKALSCFFRISICSATQLLSGFWSSWEIFVNEFRHRLCATLLFSVTDIQHQTIFIHMTFLNLNHQPVSENFSIHN